MKNWKEMDDIVVVILSLKITHSVLSGVEIGKGDLEYAREIIRG